jgi:HEAT repeat protein
MRGDTFAPSAETDISSAERASGRESDDRSSPSRSSASASLASTLGTSEERAPSGSLAELRNRAVSVLLTLARSGTAEEKAHAIEALRFSEPDLARLAPEALLDSSPGVRGVTAMALAKSRSCAATAEVHQLLSDRTPQVRASAILSLWRCNRRVDPTPLAGMLRSKNPQERAQAAWVLGEMGEESALSMLQEAARDSMKRVSAGAARVTELQIAEARVKLGDEDALTDIRTALLPARNEDLEATAFAAQILGDLNDRGATNSLIALAEYKDNSGKMMPPEVRLAAIGALARLGQPKGGPLALELSDHADVAVRSQAAAVFGVLRSTEYLPTLEKMLDDPSGKVRAAAAMAILQTAGSRGIRAGG